jgi:hypothetical protein
MSSAAEDVKPPMTGDHLARRITVAEVLVQFGEAIVGENGIRYHAHACGAPMADGKWQGWIEFIPVDGGQPVRSARETTQPNRTDAEYWATGLTAVYLQGALKRALSPLVVRRAGAAVPIFDEPASGVHRTVDSSPVVAQDAVLDPFAVYEKEGEPLLRGRLAALAPWHLANIIAKYELSEEPPDTLTRLPAASLIERIVSGVRSQTRTSHARP